MSVTEVWNLHCDCEQRIPETFVRGKGNLTHKH